MVRSTGRSGDVCGARPLITVLCLAKSGAGRFLVRTSASMSSHGWAVDGSDNAVFDTLPKGVHSVVDVLRPVI